MFLVPTSFSNTVTLSPFWSFLHSVSPNRCEHTRSCTEGADRSVRLVRDHGNLHILQIGPTSPKWTVSIQRGRNMRPTWGQLRPARPQLRPNLDQLAPTSAKLGPKMAQLGRNLDPCGSNFGPSWGPYGLGLSSLKLTQVGHLWAAQGQVGPNPSQFSGLSMRHAETSHVYSYFQPFGAWFARSLVAHIGLRQTPPHRTKLCVVSPTCVQTCPSCAMLDPVSFWLGQVGPLPSSPSYSLGAGGSHREAIWISLRIVHMFQIRRSCGCGSHLDVQLLGFHRAVHAELCRQGPQQTICFDSTSLTIPTLCLSGFTNAEYAEWN